MSQCNRRLASCLCVAVGLGTLACTTRSSHDQPHELPIVGTWSLESIPPDSSPGRMMLDIRVDSLSEARLRGYLVHYFAGDVGMDSRAFPHFEGEIGSDSMVRLEIRSAANPAVGFNLSGVMLGDTIQLTTFIVGPDTLSGPERHWRLVKQEE